jgi:hypothetical protein
MFGGGGGGVEGIVGGGGGVVPTLADPALPAGVCGGVMTDGLSTAGGRHVGAFGCSAQAFVPAVPVMPALSDAFSPLQPMAAKPATTRLAPS